MFFKKKSNKFPFEDAPNTACFVCVHITEGSRPILYVSHDEEDGAWQFLCGGEHEVGDARIISLEEAYALDESIGKLSNMPLGCFAERSGIKENWKIYRKG